jgi:uncharacterized protein (DUF1330 family)
LVKSFPIGETEGCGLIAGGAHYCVDQKQFYYLCSGFAITYFTHHNHHTTKKGNNMKYCSVTFRTGTAIELSFASIISGKEQQLFGEYFPKVTPIVGEMGGKPLGSISISQSAASLGKPQMSAFFQWPNTEAFKKLHADPRFQDIMSLRDEALDLFSNGHFFAVDNDTEVRFDRGETYGLLAENDGRQASHHETLVEFVPAGEVVDMDFHPVRVRIVKWSEHLDGLLGETMEASASPLDIFKFEFNFPKAA